MQELNKGVSHENFRKRAEEIQRIREKIESPGISYEELSNGK